MYGLEDRNSEKKIMSAHLAHQESGSELGMLPRAYREQRWYAACTRSNHEKTVAEQLGVRGVEHFLPLYKSGRRWKDRRVTLERPLFPGYVFVRLALPDRFQVWQIPGVAHLVSFGGQPTALQDEDIRAIQNCLASDSRMEPYVYLQAGHRARVKSGPLQGLEGVVLRRKNKTRLILSFDLIMRSVAVEIEEIHLGQSI